MASPSSFSSTSALFPPPPSTIAGGASKATTRWINCSSFNHCTWQELGEKASRLLFTVRMFCLFSVPSTQVMSRRRRSMTAEVAIWVRRSPVNPCFTLMYSMTCKHVYWYEYQFCTSRAKTTVRSQFTMERQQTTWTRHGFCAPPKPMVNFFKNDRLKARRESAWHVYIIIRSRKIKA